MGILLALILTACASAIPLPGAPEVDSTATSLPLSPSRVPADALPTVCSCTLRFDHIGVEQGLSQSSVHVIFQDRRGFIWFGTEDGLNRYDGYNFKIFKPEPNNSNSLSSGWITSIVEDQQGYLWIGTNLLGLNRFNPQTGRFTQYFHDDKIAGSLSDDHIKTLMVDHNNQLWIGTAHGLDQLDPETGVFHHYPAADPTIISATTTPKEQLSEPDINRTDAYPGGTSQSLKLSDPNITAIFEDSRERIWVGTMDGGLNVIDPEAVGFTMYQHVESSLSSLSSNHINAIVEDNDGKIWIGTNYGLNEFDTGTGKFRHFRHDKNIPYSLSDNNVTSMDVDETGNLWVGTYNGLNRLGRFSVQFVHYNNDPSYNKSLGSDFIISIYEDRGGVLWFGTAASGVEKYDWGRSLFAYYRHEPGNPNSLSGNSIFPIYVDKMGGAWLGTAGDGLNRFSWKTDRFITYQNDPQNPDSLGSNWILSILEDDKNFIWVGTNNGLDQLNQNTGVFKHFRHDPLISSTVSGNSIYSLFEDSHKNIWVGTSAGLDRLNRQAGEFIHYQPNSKDPGSISGTRPLAIIEDSKGYLWIGTVESGLNRFDPKTNQFTQYHHDPNKVTSLSNDSIYSIYQDTSGRMWIGTGGGGLGLYHGETDSFTYYLESDGLPNGVVYGIVEDAVGALWLSTNLGISHFDPGKGTFQNFDANDGLQSNEFNSSAFAKGKDGELYFGGINGLTVFRPDEITANPQAPQVSLTSLTHDNQPIPITSSVETVRQVTLKWPQNSLEFEFAALSFNQPTKNQYAYLLEGFDSNWHFIGTKRDGRYTNLPGGDYTLLLKAANNNGVWNESPERIGIKVIPPFWQTAWFRTLVGIFLFAAVISGIRLRTKSIQDRNRQLENVVRERTMALEKRNLEIQALYQADERILRNVSLNQVFQTLVDVAVDTLGADRSVVFEWDQKQAKLIPRVSRGFQLETLKVLEFGKGEGIIGRVLETGLPEVVRRVELDDFRPDIREAIIAEGIRSFVHLPIIVDNHIVGVFNVGFTNPNIIGDDTTRLFSALTQRASISIANMELFEQTKELAVIEERNRLARDLHDSAKQKAFAALAQLGTVRGKMNGSGSPVEIHLSEAENLVSDVIQELTFLVQEIYPIALQEKGLPVSLREYVYEWENRNEIKVSLAIINERPMPLGLEQAIYRVTQESLANIARHSKAKHVNLSLMYNGGTMQLSVADDGCGFDLELKGRGLGLRSIRERVNTFNGTLQIQSTPGQGTKLLVTVPVEV